MLSSNDACGLSHSHPKWWPDSAWPGREEIWMKANPLSGGSSCMEELTWIVGQGDPLLSHLLAGCRWIRGGNEWNFTTRLKVKELNY